MPKQQKRMFYPTYSDKTQSSFFSPSLKKIITFDWLRRGLQTRRDTETGEKYYAGYFSSFLRREK